MVWGSFLLVWIFGILTVLSIVSVFYGISDGGGRKGCWFFGLGLLIGILSLGMLLAVTSRRQSMYTRQQVDQYLHATWHQPYSIDKQYWDNATTVFYSNGNEYIATLNADNTVTIEEHVVVSSGKVK